MEVSGQLHAPAALLPGKKTPGTHRTGGWVRPRRGSKKKKNPLVYPCRESNPGCPVHSLITLL